MQRLCRGVPPDTALTFIEFNPFQSSIDTICLSPLHMFRNPVHRVTALSRLLVDHLSRGGAFESQLHTSAACGDVLAASEAWNFSPRDACLTGTRGVLRLGGSDVIHFLQARTNRVSHIGSAAGWSRGHVRSLRLRS